MTIAVVSNYIVVLVLFYYFSPIKRYRLFVFMVVYKGGTDSPSKISLNSLFVCLFVCLPVCLTFETNIYIKKSEFFKAKN